MQNKIYILLDRSGSMATMWSQALDGINGYVRKLNDLNADVMLAVFDTNGHDVLRNTNTLDWKPLTQEEVSPRGGTPLLDSAGRIMWNMMDSKAERAILVVVTDGYENASTHFKAEHIKEMTRTLTTKYNYDIVFLGANFDGIQDVAAQNFGINDAGKFMVSSVGGFGEAMGATAAATSNYLATGRGVSYTADEKLKAKS
jgi:hypothetical protein